MAKKRHSRKITNSRQEKQKELLEESDFEDNPDPESNEYFYDEVDDLEANKEKILLNDGARLEESEEESDEEGVMDLDVSDDEEEESDEDADMDSDLEDEDDGLPDEKAWGKKKGMYYNTDYEDKDYMDFGGSDGEAAEAEEKEALTIQKRMAQTLQDADFGLLDFQTPVKADEDKVNKVQKDLSSMSKREKIQLLQKESPEFLGICEEFKVKMSEIMRIEPLLELVKDGRIPEGAGSSYISTKYHLLLTYLTNISFYMILKSRHIKIENHPVVKRILEFRMLLQQLEPVDEKLNSEITSLLQMIENKEEIPVIEKNAFETKKMSDRHKQNEKLHQKIKKQLTEKTAGKNQKKEKKTVRFSDNLEISNHETEDEKRAIEMYNMMKSIKKKNKYEEESDSSEELDDIDLNVEDQDEEIKENINAEIGELGDENDEYSDKREITYQIAKNKGMTPHRKKERRNPRVKHRSKFRKAKIRRKGQIREPRTEMKRYGGEVAGIRAGVRHSVKIK